MSELLALTNQYVNYCDCLSNFRDTGKIDLSSYDFFFPTTLLPICNLIMENTSVTYTPPSNVLVDRYIDTMINPSPDGGTGTYVPIVQLIGDSGIGVRDMNKVYQIQKNDPTIFGNESVFNYVVGELIDNIHEHSKCTRAMIMGQKYETKRFIDLCFFDNGITIPKTFENEGYGFKPYEAIAEAINGVSTIHEDRGYGLRTSTKICVQGLKGIIQVVSDSGAVYYSENHTKYFQLSDKLKLDGTLITLRIPYPAPSIDLYQYVE